MTDVTPDPHPTPPEQKPVSLREDASSPEPLPPAPASNGSTQGLLTVSAAVVVFAGLIIAALLLRNDNGIDEDTLRDAVNEAVGTQVGAFGLAPGDPETGRASLQDMIDNAVGTQVSGSAPIGGSGEGVSQADLAQLVENSVGTQVAALVPTETPIPPTPTPIPIADTADDDAFRGPEDAPVTIVEFSDFQCVYCGRFYEETLPRLLEAYPDEVRFVYRDFPIFGDDSVRAAMAAECAAEQDMFWEMHDRIFAIHNEDTAPTLSQETLISFADEIGLDTAEFETCLVEERYMDEIIGDFQTAQAYGFRGTPGFVINGVVYSFGAQPFEVFDAIIQQELEAAS
ncbi:MAG: thioredoxin domain-containing protein [Chloroflexi bacterium]|nr:thioredoxin domain-containing protein [Chloroflexota bacterium]